MKKKRIMHSSSYPSPDGHPTRHRPRRNTGGICMMRTPLTRIVTTLQQILTLRCMTQRMIMIPIMKMADMNK